MGTLNDITPSYDVETGLLDSSILYDFQTLHKEYGKTPTEEDQNIYKNSRRRLDRDQLISKF